VRAWLEARLTRLWWQREPAALPTLLLFPFSIVYLLLWMWRRHWARPAEPLSVPVVVVGNHVVGGAGKTPTVMALVQALKAAGYRPGVISRGHGRQCDEPQAVWPGSAVAEVGDEPPLIARRTGVPVWVGRARRDAGMALLKAQPDVDVIVSDDGLQHLGLNRHAELVVFDERGAGNGMLLPAGPLREPLPATVPPRMRVLYTAGVASTSLPGALAKRRLGNAWPLQAWHDGDAAQVVPLLSLQGRPLVAAAGLAAPEKFFGMLRANGLEFRALPLPDHHSYPHLPWPEGTADVLTTEKDAIKLQPSRLGGTRVWVVPLDLDIPSALVDELLALLPARRPAARTPS
jgi:tetraacyldisaccharide 4'-kinase